MARQSDQEADIKMCLLIGGANLEGNNDYVSLQSRAGEVEQGGLFLMTKLLQ